MSSQDPGDVYLFRVVLGFRAALLDYPEGKDVPELVLEARGGWTGSAMHPVWFFRSFEQWDWWDRKILPFVEQGPVLDLGAGPGRAALYLQQWGLSVTAVDASPGCRGVPASGRS